MGGGGDCLWSTETGTDASVDPPRPVLLLAMDCAAIPQGIGCDYRDTSVNKVLVAGM